MAFDDFFADGQTDASTNVTLLAVETLEDDENAVKVLRVDADPVVLERETPETVVRLRLDADADAWSFR